MLATGIEQEPRPRFDDAAQLALLQQAPNSLGVSMGIRRFGIQDMMIDSERDAAVSQIGENRERIIETMMSETVCVVTEEHAWAR